MLSFLHPLSLSLTVRRRRRRMKMSSLPDAYSHSLAFTGRRRRRERRSRRRELPSFLPDEIMENIFARLPVKSIARFRCVSKYWLHQFQNPNFIKNHLNHSIRINRFNALLTNVSYCNVLSVTSSPSLSRIDYPFTVSQWEPPEIQGSSHGLVCIKNKVTGDLSDDEFFYIWNPATREYKLLPEPLERSTDHRRGGKQKVFFREHGFGFDCKNDDYKFLRLATFCRKNFMVQEARIYSLASNSWKNLGLVPYCFPFSETKGFLVNGVLHWIATGLHHADPESAVIVCFDISDETFYDVPLPPCDFDHHCLPFLGIWEGKLCLLHQNHTEEDPDHIDVWTMMNNKWMKHSQITALVTEMEYIRPIHTLSNGEILFEGEPRAESRVEDGFHLISYDPKLERARALNIKHGLHDFPGPEVEIYIETLAALNSGTYVRNIEMEWKGSEEVPGWCGEFGKRSSIT